MSTATANPFASKATNTSGGSYESPAGGSYPCVLVAVIDMGTHREEYQGESYDSRKLFLVWELTAENNSKGETFKVGREFPFPSVLSSKNPLRKLLEGWRSTAFAENEPVDPTAFLLQPGVINLTEGANAKGKKFVAVSGVTKPMKGLTIPPHTVEPLVWSFDGHHPDQEPPIPEWVPYTYGKKVSDVCRSSKEWSQLTPF